MQTTTTSAGQGPICDTKTFTKVEDRPIVKEVKTYVREHHPVEKEVSTLTRVWKFGWLAFQHCDPVHMNFTQSF